jgi:hypothetical protein
LLVPALLEWPARFRISGVIGVPCVTSDIYPTVLEVAGVKPARQLPLDGISLVPVLEGRVAHRANPIGFWDYPAPGIAMPAKQWMEELYAEQQQGHEPQNPDRLFPAAAQIRTQVPMDRFPGHAAWLDGQWKLHRIEDVKTGRVRWELYDLSADPQENRDLLAHETERSVVMQRELGKWLGSVARSLNGEDYR